MGPKQYSGEKDDVRIMLKTLYRKLPQNYLSETEKCQKYELGEKKQQCAVHNMIAFKICLAASLKVNVKLLLSMSLF